jgi:hypothetical protein
MPLRVGGDFPDPINTETEYAGKVPMPNTVGDLGPEVRKLEPHERLRLGYLTGQEEDPEAPRETGFMGGVDSRHPEHDDMDLPGEDFFSEDYLE